VIGRSSGVCRFSLRTVCKFVHHLGKPGPGNAFIIILVVTNPFFVQDRWDKKVLLVRSAELATKTVHPCFRPIRPLQPLFVPNSFSLPGAQS
jgi:hypothetical protein